MNRAKMEDESDCSRVASVAVPSSTTTDDDPGKRRHSTPSCGTAHLLRLGADSPGNDDVRCRRSGSAAPRRVNRTLKDDYRRTALPPWAKAVRSSHGDSSTSLQCRSSGGAMAEAGHDGVRLDSMTNDARGSAASAVRRQEHQQTNYSIDERLDHVDSMNSSGRSSGIRFESQFSCDTGLSPPRDHVISPQPPTTGQARLPQQRRSSIAFLPVSESSTGSSLFSSKSVGPHAATKDRINLGFGNASDLMASLMGSRNPGPTAGATGDHFWVPPTIWRKTRTQSLVPQKLSTDIRAGPGKSLLIMQWIRYVNIGY